MFNDARFRSTKEGWARFAQYFVSALLRTRNYELYRWSVRGFRASVFTQTLRALDTTFTPPELLTR
jgi:hypothetical protein